MKYDLYITNESRLASPNANIVFKLGVLSVILTLFLTLFTWLGFNGYIHDVAYSTSKISPSSKVVIQNAPKIVAFKISVVKSLLRAIHWILLLFAIFYYYKANQHNESSIWVAWGLVMVGCSIYHSYSIGEFYSIEPSPIDDIIRRLDYRYNSYL